MTSLEEINNEATKLDVSTFPADVVMTTNTDTGRETWREPQKYLITGITEPVLSRDIARSHARTPIEGHEAECDELICWFGLRKVSRNSGIMHTKAI